MNQLDVYYRALLNYRKLTTANHDCTAMRSAIASADAEKDKIVIKRAFCTIESDWVEAIENGLIHIEKAIKQERQFITSLLREASFKPPIEEKLNVPRSAVLKANPLM